MEPESNGSWPSTTPAPLYNETIRLAPILEAYPSVKDPEPGIFFIATIFLLCLIVGICGNASTLTKILEVGQPHKTKKPASHKNFRFYVASLCVVDTIMLLSLPSTIVDSLMGFWIFGTAVCKFHQLCGSVGRVAPTVVIAAMSVERLIAVRKSHDWGKRSRIMSNVFLVASIVIAAGLLSPLLVFAKAEKVILFETFTAKGQVVTIRIYKCVDSMPNPILFWFTGSTFVVGYFLPMAIITSCNIALLVRIRKHQRRTSRSGIPMKKVTTYIMTIALFYFLCWTPYWMGVLYFGYDDIFRPKEEKETDTKSDAMFYVSITHIFPYINTALNWLLYGRLARNLSPGSSSSGGRSDPTFSKRSVSEGSAALPMRLPRPGGIPIETSVDNNRLLMVFPAAHADDYDPLADNNTDHLSIHLFNIDTVEDR